MKHLVVMVTLAAACAEPSAPRQAAASVPVAAPEVAAEAAPAAPAEPPRPVARWPAGDLHMHVAPPDADSVRLDVAGVARRAREAGLDFVVLTPHLWPRTWADTGRRGRFVRRWRAMAQAARAVDGVTLVPGVEYTTGRGHFGVSGVDLGALRGDFLPAADAAGAFVVVNHPFAVPTGIPGVHASHWDMSYRAWTRGGERVDPLDGAEIWNFPLSLANMVSRPGGATAEARALAAADAWARARRRPVTLVGGSDSHSFLVMATTWVRAEDTSEAAIVTALRAGATCVGGPEAGSLEARGEGDWVPIGGHVRATSRVDLRFAGRARVFVDGVDRGEHDGTFTHAADRAPHTYRIVVGASRSGFVYANFE